MGQDGTEKEQTIPGYKKHDAFFDGPAWKRELPSAQLFNGVKKNEDPDIHVNQKLKHDYHLIKTEIK